MRFPDILVSKLRTSLQVEQHLMLALEAGYQTGAKPVPVEVVESVLSKKLDDLIRHSYKIRDLHVAPEGLLDNYGRKLLVESKILNVVSSTIDGIMLLPVFKG